MTRFTLLFCLLSLTATAQRTVADLITEITRNDLQALHRMLTTDYPENYNAGASAIPYITNWDRGRLELRKNGQPVKEEDRTPVIFYRDLVDTITYQAPNGKEFYTFGWCSEREMAFASAAWMMGYEPVIIVRGGHAFTLVTINGTLFKVDNTYDRFEVWDYGYIPAPETKLELWYNRKAREQAAELKKIPVPEKSWNRIIGKNI